MKMKNKNNKLYNIDSTDPITLSKLKVNEIENPLSKYTYGATLFSLIQITVFISWFYWAYNRYSIWYNYKLNSNSNIDQQPKLPDTSIVTVGIPLFILSIIIELIITKLIGEKEHYRAADTVSSFSNGITQQLIETWTTLIGEWFGLALITAVPYRYIYENYAITNSLEGLSGFIFMFFARDFCYYWFHRSAHRSAFLWAIHGVHHLPNSFSYHVNLCQGGIQRISSALFYAPLALFCPPELYTIIFPMEKIYGFFTHTSLVAKPLKYIGYFFVTPSSHRVHHAGAPSKYIDKNYGEMLSIWDYIFGTHQDEEECIVFGHCEPHDSWNPIDCQLLGWRKILKKAEQCESPIQKILCFVMPPGWNPKDGTEYPLPDYSPFSGKKYDSSLPNILTGYLIGWFIPTLILAIYIIRKYKELDLILLVGLFSYVMFSLFSLGALSDRNSTSPIYEIIRLITSPIAVYLLPIINNNNNYKYSIITLIISIISILIIISYNSIFIKESKSERDRRIWIKEAGRDFNNKLNNQINQLKNNNQDQLFENKINNNNKNK